jgi:hypothetical protein
MRLSHVGDPAGQQRDSSQGTWFRNLAKGAEWNVAGVPRKVGVIHMLPAYAKDVLHRSTAGYAARMQSGLAGISKDEMIQAVDFMLHRRRLGVHPRAKNTILALLNYHQHVTKQGEIVFGRGPVHDKWSHSADRIQYGVINSFGVIGVPVAAAR